MSDQPVCHTFVSGAKWWIIEGRMPRFHREDGPAIINADGSQEWYYQGKYIPIKSQKEFESYLRMKAFW